MPRQVSSLGRQNLDVNELTAAIETSPKPSTALFWTAYGGRGTRCGGQRPEQIRGRIFLVIFNEDIGRCDPFLAAAVIII